MTIKSYVRGHEIHYKDGWFYLDGEKLENERPCIRCGKLPTEDGHDHCLGRLNGVVSACCGHGIGKEIYIESN